MTANPFRLLREWASERRAFSNTDPLTEAEFAVLREADVEAKAVRRHRRPGRRNALRHQDPQW